MDGAAGDCKAEQYQAKPPRTVKTWCIILPLKVMPRRAGSAYLLVDISKLSTSRSSASHQLTMSLPNLEKVLWNSNRNQTSLLSCIRLGTVKGCSGAFPSDPLRSMTPLFFLLGEGRYPTRNFQLPPLVHSWEDMDAYHQKQRSLQAHLIACPSHRNSPI